MTDNRYGTSKSSNINVKRDDVLKPRRNDRNEKNPPKYRNPKVEEIENIK